MVKYVSAITGKVTYVGEEEKTPTVTKSVSAKTGEVTYSVPTAPTEPELRVPKNFAAELTKDQEKDYWGTKKEPTIETKPEVKAAYKSVSASVPVKTPFGSLQVDVPRDVYEEAKAKTKDAVESEESFKRFDVQPVKPVSDYQPKNLFDVRDIGQVPGVLGRSLQSSVDFLFPITKGTKYSQEELKSWKEGETQKEFEDRMGLQRGFWTGVTLATTAIPVGAAVHAGKGLTGAFAGAGAKSIYATKGVGTVALEKGAGLATGTMWGKLLTGIGLYSVGSQVAVPATKGTIEAIEPSKITKSEQAEVSRTARERMTERVKEEGLDLPFVGEDVEKFTKEWVGETLTELPGGIALAQTTYTEETKKILMEQGYSEAEAEKITQTEAKREIYGQTIGEIGALVVSAGGVGELAGRGAGYVTGTKLGAGGTKVLTPAATKVASTTTGAVAGVIGGAAETFLMYPALKASRYQEIKGEEWASDIALGAATAGLAGGVIGYLSAGHPTLAKGFYNVLGLAEGGQEFAGDVAAQKIVGSSFDVMFMTAGGKQAVKTGVVSAVPSLTQAFTKTQSKTPLTETRGATREFSPQEQFARESLINKDAWGIGTPIKSMTKTPTPTKTKTESELPTIVSTPTRTSIYSETPSETITKTFADTPTPTESFIGTPSESFVVVPTKTETPTETPTKTVTETPTQTPTFSYTFTPTPTATSTFTGDILPFIPPIIGGESGTGKKGSRRERTRFIDEFSLAFAGLARPGQPISFGKKGKSITKTKKAYAPKKSRVTKTKFNSEKLRRFLF